MFIDLLHMCEWYCLLSVSRVARVSLRHVCKNLFDYKQMYARSVLGVSHATCSSTYIYVRDP